MKISVKARGASTAEGDLLAVPVSSEDAKEKEVPSRLSGLDRELGGALAASLETGDFRGQPGEALALYPGEGGVKRVVVLGAGEAGSVDAEQLRALGAAAVSQAATRRVRSATLLVPPTRGVRTDAAAQALAEGAVLASYRCDAYREAKEEAPEPPAELVLVFSRLQDPRAARAAVARGIVLAESQNLARELSNTPGNEMPPASLAAAARKMARQVGLRCQVFGVPELEKRKMGALLAVGQGSSRPPRLIVLDHSPGGARAAKTRKRPTLCIVGKGITFDSGGISIKPAGGMQDMKHDMSGAAVVVGAMRAVALLKLPLRVVGIIAAAENMPSGTAYRPGDVVRAMSGKTIEVVNTDAEGRVVLADALHFARTEYEPEAMVDLATLTGACVVALGPWATGAFGNDPELVEAVRSAGDRTGERIWPMPLLKEHREAMNSTIADLRNAGARDAGASTAAGFLWAFAGDTPWVHLDIAGTSWTDKSSPAQPPGATGTGVRMLLDWLSSRRPGRKTGR